MFLRLFLDKQYINKRIQLQPYTVMNHVLFPDIDVDGSIYHTNVPRWKTELQWFFFSFFLLCRYYNCTDIVNNQPRQ